MFVKIVNCARVLWYFQSRDKSLRWSSKAKINPQNLYQYERLSNEININKLAPEALINYDSCSVILTVYVCFLGNNKRYSIDFILQQIMLHVKICVMYNLSRNCYLCKTRFYFNKCIYRFHSLLQLFVLLLIFNIELVCFS